MKPFCIRWIPKLSYTNYEKEYPNMAAGCCKKLISFRSYWLGRIWQISFKHHVFELDFRQNWVVDMIGGEK